MSTRAAAPGRRPRLRHSNVFVADALPLRHACCFEHTPSQATFPARSNPTGATAAATNAGYAQLFAALGAGSLAVGVALVLLIPFLRKLITDKG
jgi:hypothetical protein